MDIYNKINEIKNEIIRKMMLLKSDKRFHELVEILEQKDIAIETKFLNKLEKTDRDWREYYAELSLFLRQDIMRVVKMYEFHKYDFREIYDDSSKEINSKLVDKFNEIHKCIRDTETTYHDEVLTNYIKSKYWLINNRFDQLLADIVNRNKVNLINDLTNNYQNVSTLTVYSDATLVKNRYFEELSDVLDDFINYINSLMENKKIIADKERLIERTIKKINDSKLMQEFIKIKDNYYGSITNINSIDTKICALQKNYFQELDGFYEQVCAMEKVFDDQELVASYFDYLTNTDLYKIEFDKLLEISKYLLEHNNLELDQLLTNTYYQLIKLEVYYNHGKSYLYYQLSDRMKLAIERLFLNELTIHQEELMKKYAFEEFVNNKFSLELLTKFVRLISSEDLPEVLNKYQTDIITKEQKDEKFKSIPFIPFGNSHFFDDNGEILILRDKYDDNEIGCHYAGREYPGGAICDRLYVASRNGDVKKVSLYNATVSSIGEYYSDFKYHDGVIIYKYCSNWVNHVIIADTKETIGDYVCEIITEKATWKSPYFPITFDSYREGLIRIIDRYNEKRSIFLDKNGEFVFETKKNCDFVQSYSSGYSLMGSSSRGKLIYEFFNNAGKREHTITIEKDEAKTVFPFIFGVGVIRDNNNPEKSIFFDTNFEQIYEDYEYQELASAEVDDMTIVTYCLKSKKDGVTYIPEKDGLLAIHKDDIMDYYLADSYQLVEDNQGKLMFIKKANLKINRIIDILRRQINGDEQSDNVDNDRIKNNHVTKMELDKMKHRLRVLGGGK